MPVVSPTVGVDGARRESPKEVSSRELRQSESGSVRMRTAVRELPRSDPLLDL